MRRNFWACFILLIILGTAGCNPVRSLPPSSTPQQIPNAPTATKSLELAPANQITQENTVSIQLPSTNPIVVQASKDLARQLGVELEAIKVISAENVVWPDGGLGCPRPGMVYPQVQQDGMRIVLAVNGKQYRYHSGERRPAFLCE
ncbi:hypothetical protein BH10CHL1_BH10CHL1_10620 [soil metagenome]